MEDAAQVGIVADTELFQIKHLAPTGAFRSTELEPSMEPTLDTLPAEYELALEKFDRQQERTITNQGFGDTEGGLRLAKKALGRVSEVVAAKLAEGGSGDDRPLVIVLRGLDPKVIALAGLQTAVHSVAMEYSLTSTLQEIGLALANEAWSAKLTEDAPKVHSRITKAVMERYGSRRSRSTQARVLAAKAGYKTRMWSKPLQVKAGGWLMGILLQAVPDLFVIETTMEVMKHEAYATDQHLTLTEDALTILEGGAELFVRNHPAYQPSAREPKPWTSFSQGALWDDTIQKAVMRTPFGDVRAAFNAAARDGTAKPALDALNGVQSVAWTINTRVLGVLKACLEKGIPMKGIPGHRQPMPEWVDDMTKDQKRLAAVRANKTRVLNLGLRSDLIELRETLATADKLAEMERFYTPMNLDWRGRVYGMPHFNFQREDRCRALFLFADGAPLGEKGLYWLKVHVANCGDFDKVSKKPFDQRAAWVDNNLERIKEMTWCPTKELWWTKADKPFLFLAACIELSSALENGPTYVTRLPVSFDGSCSGLQHLCAMTRAPEGRLVNLTPGEQPQDVYQVVADRVNEKLRWDAEHGLVEAKKSSNGREYERDQRQLACLCLEYGIGRTVVKRNVMTYSYSSRKFGMTEQQREDLMKPLVFEVLEGKREEHPFGPDEGLAASAYLAGLIFDAIEEVINLPAQAMGFLQQIAKAMAHEGKPARWVTPAGLPWINRYHEVSTTKVKLWLHDRGVTTLTVADGSYEKDINKKKAANGIAPNFVHACDAAHLLRTVNAAREAGITSVATVHDSFGCLASHAERFRQIIREEFVRMYSEHDVLREVLEAAQRDLTLHNQDRLPNVPAYGSLDLQEVLNAEYAFA